MFKIYCEIHHLEACSIVKKITLYTYYNVIFVTLQISERSFQCSYKKKADSHFTIILESLST